MGLINITALKNGMVLAEDVRDRNGRFLAAGGTTLTDKHIRILKMWGVVEADIQGVTKEEVEQKLTEDIDSATLEAAEKLTRDRFALNDAEHPAIRELYHLCVARKAREIQQGEETAAGNGNGVSPPAATHTAKAVPPNVADFLNHEIKLPTLPGIFLKINETITRPNSSAFDIANLISKDTSLSARLLKIVNSAFYGFPSKIDNLFRAVSIVGTNQLSTLATGVSLIDAFRKVPSAYIDMGMFWRHSIVCGTIGRIVAGYKNIQNTERLFVAGLFHDIGRLLLLQYAPEISCEMLQVAKRNGHVLYELERDRLGFDHAIIGGKLLEQWKLPFSLENVVTHHHEPLASRSPLEPAILNLADIVTHAVAGGCSGQRLIPRLHEAVWKTINLSENTLPLIIKQADRQSGEIFGFFYGDASKN
mgnify:CR=1 FL=1